MSLTQDQRARITEVLARDPVALRQALDLVIDLAFREEGPPGLKDMMRYVETRQAANAICQERFVAFLRGD